MSSCLFCKILEKQVPAEIVYEDANVIAFLDIKPVNPGHTLVIHRHHHVDILDTPAEDLAALMVGAQKVAAKLISSGLADGVNLGMNNKTAAGQLILHAHLHVIPRRSNDGLKHWSHKDATPEQLKIVGEKLRTSIS